jgi:hypothetical protein
VVSLGAQGPPLADAEAVLLVDHGQAEGFERPVLLDQGVGSDQDVDLAGGAGVPDALLLRPAQTTADQVHVQPEGCQQAGDGAMVLLGEDLGRGHQGRLVAVADGDEGGRGRDHRLARADVALQQPAHRQGAGHIARDLADHAALGCRELERQQGGEVLEHARTGRQRDPRLPLLPLPATAQHADLDQQQLVEGQTPARGRERGVVLRKVGGRDRLRERRQAGHGHPVRRKRVTHLRQAGVQGEPDPRANLLVRDALRLGIEGHQAPGVQQVLGVELELGRDELQGPVRARLYPSAEDDPPRSGKGSDQVRLVEPHGVAEPGIVLQHGVGHGQAVTRVAPGLHLPDRGEDGRLPARRQGGQGRHRSPVEVAPGEVVEQVAHAVHAQLG